MATNHIQESGFVYDAAGNLLNDSFHSYTYDAEGNVVSVDGQTATYTYDGLNQRVRSVVSGVARELAFNLNGQRVSAWDGNTGALVESKVYWNGRPLAYRDANGMHFEQGDWTGTERIRTSYNGATEGDFLSLSFGDGFGVASGGVDSDAFHFAMLDHDYESETDHAQFRQYSNLEGRWMSPDPSLGSYDFTNPQSFNRYTYVLNRTLGYVDVLGLDDCSESWTTDSNGQLIDTTNCTVNGGGGDGWWGSIPGGWPPPSQPGGGGGGGGNAPSNTTCTLSAPGGNYNLGPNAVALFQPQMSAALTNAFNFLNSQGITPTINSGYRSPADQIRMQNGGSGPNPAATVSWHQAGMAVDINGTSSSFFPTIISAMQAQGLTWGGTFTHRDPPHFQLPRPGTSPSAATVKACAATAGGHG